MEARLLAEKLQLAATTKEERAELASELDKLKAERLATVQVRQRRVSGQWRGSGGLPQLRTQDQTLAPPGGSPGWQVASMLTFQCPSARP
jgi:hypothetical protein